MKALHSTPILGTKLYRPSTTEFYISRKALEARLEAAQNLPLTVVSAPAGYGKSSLISHWLQTTDTPSTWLSLDDSDSDVRLFLTYLVEALRKVSVDACESMLKILDSDTIPPISILSTYLSNEIIALGKRVTLVLDDYHRISEPDIHLILDTLLQHPPDNLHLVLISRYDPPLPLSTLRANHQLNEIRMRELEFTDKEAFAFFRKFGKHSLEPSAVKSLRHNMEGWPAGMLLAALAMEHHDNAEIFLKNFGTNSQSLQDYLSSEVLSGQSAQMKDFLLCSSILDRFNASLCEAVRSDVMRDNDNPISGKDFVATLESSGLFCISLDGSQDWFRFHHLFSSLLQKQLEETRSSEEIGELHENASRWFSENGYIEDAIRHALASGNIGGAAEIVGHARHDLMNGDEWHRLARWLNLFSYEAVEQNPQLLLLRCWIDLYHWYRLDNLARDLNTADALLESPSTNAHEIDQLKAEVAAIRSNLTCWILKPEQAGKLAIQALRDTPDEHECVQSTALFGWGASCQMLGDLHKGERILWDHMGHGHFKNSGSQARLLLALGIAYWPEAEPNKLQKAANRLLEIDLDNKLLWSESFARYFLGLGHYDRNELTQAKEHLEIIANNPYRYPIQNVTHCSFLLSLTYQAEGCFERAIEIANTIDKINFERGNEMFVNLAEAFMAYLEFLQGRVALANHWAQGYERPAPHLMQRFFNSELAFIKVMMAQDTSKSRNVAAEQLDYLHDLLNRTHNKRLLIDVLGMKAIVADSEGDVATADLLLKEAVFLSQPGKLIRPLVDLGPRLVKPLNRLNLHQEGLQFVGIIISALQKKPESKTATSGDQFQTEILSQRELEILDLLAKDLSNKEIANQLFISPGTVKRHAHNIYNKLSVSGRHNAVSKAVGLGILSSS